MNLVGLKALFLFLGALAITLVISGFWLNYQGLQNDLAEAVDARAKLEQEILDKDRRIAERDFVIQELQDQAEDTQRKLADLERAESEAYDRWLQALEDIAVPSKDDLTTGSIYEAADRLRTRNSAVNRMLEWETRR